MRFWNDKRGNQTLDQGSSWSILYRRAYAQLKPIVFLIYKDIVFFTFTLKRLSVVLEAKWDTFYLIFTSVYEHTPDLFRQTKRLTKMISSDEPMGFHITVPIIL